MRLNWLSGITLVLIVSACGTVTRPASPPHAGKGIHNEVPRSVPLPGPTPTVQPPPADPKPTQRTRIADVSQADTVQPSEEGDGEPTAVVADPEGNIFFPAGKTQVDESGKTLLRRYAERMKNNSDLVITLIGHVDPLGSRSYSLALAEERLDSVYQILRSMGVPRGQIRRVNSGRTPVNLSCSSPSCRRLAMRVELMIAQ